jgi:8-oxo-dGTP diphosphatase
MIREVWEETGLTIETPKLCGLYHWHKGGVHYVITLYRADRFIGELTCSEEGQVYWIPLEELKTKELATGMEYVLQILESEQVNECYMHLEADGYVGDLY